MLFTLLTFENPHTGAIKEAPIGMSWTTGFFGFLPALFRGDFKWAVIMLILGSMTFWISFVFFVFAYNHLYIKDLIGSGFKAKSVSKGTMERAERKLGFKLPMLETNKR